MIETREIMAMTMPTPRDVLLGVRQNLLPWLGVKGVLTALVLAGHVGVWTAFVLDTAMSALVVAYGWWLTRR